MTPEIAPNTHNVIFHTLCVHEHAPSFFMNSVLHLVEQVTGRTSSRSVPASVEE